MMNLCKIITTPVLILLLWPVETQAQVPALTVNDGSLNEVSWDVCVERARAALETEGFSNITSGGAGPESQTVFVGGKHSIYAASIMCRPKGSSGSTYTIAVASNRGDAAALRTRLRNAMHCASTLSPAAQLSSYVGKWRLDNGREISLRLEGKGVALLSWALLAGPLSFRTNIANTAPSCILNICPRK